MNFHSKPTTFVSQLTIKVQDLDRSLKFYEQIIGFKVLEKIDSSASFTADGKNVLLKIEQPENVIPKQPRTSGLYHFAILLPTRADLGKFISHMIQIQYPVQGASDHLVSEALYLADPDGNGIEIYSDRPSSEWKWNGSEVVMTTEPMDVQGVLAAGQGAAWNGLPAGTVMGHIHLHVSELEKSGEFYTKGLGFEVVCSFAGQALFMSTGKYHHHIAINTWSGIGAPAAPENGVGLESYTVVLENEEKRNEIIEQLKNVGAPVTEEQGTYITVDPSGNRIKLTV